jgi:predicted thioesterase
MEPGATWKFRYTVTEADTAAALNPITGDRFPAVLSTTRTIALLELAAGRLLKAECKPGQLSVGVVVEVKHTAATPAGAWVEAEATYTGRNGKLYAFEVVARDPAGEVMRGRHERAVIDEARLLESARQRGT